MYGEEPEVNASTNCLTKTQHRGSDERLKATRSIPQTVQPPSNNEAKLEKK